MIASPRKSEYVLSVKRQHQHSTESSKYKRVFKKPLLKSKFGSKLTRQRGEEEKMSCVVKRSRWVEGQGGELTLGRSLSRKTSLAALCILDQGLSVFQLKKYEYKFSCRENPHRHSAYGFLSLECTGTILRSTYRMALISFQRFREESPSICWLILENSP